MSGTYYFKVKDEYGEEVILVIQFHHNDIYRIEEIDEEKMQKEIKDNLGE